MDPPTGTCIWTSILLILITIVVTGRTEELLRMTWDSDQCLAPATSPSICGPSSPGLNLNRYTFDLERGACVMTHFSGCRPTLNMFESIHDCRRLCQTRVVQLQNDLQAVQQRQRCFIDPLSSGCLATDVRSNKNHRLAYFFSRHTGTCVSFNVQRGLACEHAHYGNQTECQRDCGYQLESTNVRINNRCLARPPKTEQSCREDAPLLQKWFYLPAVGSCVPHTVCQRGSRAAAEDRGNSFWSLNSCARFCLVQSIAEVCSQPQDPGSPPTSGSSSSSSVFRYSYDPQLQRCFIFLYYGHMGNLNRFFSDKECIKACFRDTISSVNNLGPEVPVRSLVNLPFTMTKANISSLYEPITDGDPCLEPVLFQQVTNPDSSLSICPATNHRGFHYNHVMQSCQSHPIYLCGPGPGRNSFHSLQQCDRLCTNRLSTSVLAGRPRKCRPNTGSCSSSPSLTSAQPSFAWQPRLSVRGLQCEQSFCQAPLLNRGGSEDDRAASVEEQEAPFTSERDCTETCLRTAATPRIKDLSDVCHLPQLSSSPFQSSTNSAGKCPPTSQAWTFQLTVQRCQKISINPSNVSLDSSQLVNQFSSLKKCQRSCLPGNIREVCSQPMNAGACVTKGDDEGGGGLQFYFDPPQRSCRPFNYSGCLGNKNRFPTVAGCQTFCLPYFSSSSITFFYFPLLLLPVFTLLLNEFFNFF